MLFFVAFPWVETSTGPGGFMICVFIICVRELPKAQPKVVLWRPATPGLQGIALIHYTNDAREFQVIYQARCSQFQF